MSEEAQLEIAISGTDDATVDDIMTALADVGAERWPQTRDLQTILTVASSAVALVNALLDLRDRFFAQRAAPADDTVAAGAPARAAGVASSIVIRNVERLEINLADATPESLQALLASARSAPA